MSSYAVAPVHERRHRAGESAEWTELWHYEFGQDEAGLGGFVRFALQPRQRRTQFWAGVVRVGDGVA